MTVAAERPALPFTRPNVLDLAPLYDVLRREAPVAATPSGTAPVSVAEETPAVDQEPAPFTRRNPTGARLVANEVLTGAGSAKDVRRFALRIPEGCTYQAGDALGVQPVNDPDVVAWVQLCRIRGGA